MLEEHRMVFDVDINNYIANIMKFIQERLEINDIIKVCRVETFIKHGKTQVKSVSICFESVKYKEYINNAYSVSVNEKVFPISNGRIYTKKYSYELKNDNDTCDYIRFDYKISNTFPHLHINADENRWGKHHFTYPVDTNLDLEKLDSIKALNIFQRFINNLDNHILDNKNNSIYISILNGK